MKPARFFFCAAASVTLALSWPSGLATALQSGSNYTVVATFPHDPDAFTQGFEFFLGRLYEGTGLYGESTLRRVQLATGEVKRRKTLNERYFGEGITILGRRIYQLTWRENVAFVYRRRTWKRIKKFSYSGEGWGLTNNGRRLIMSNGSARIFFRDPGTFRTVRRINVTNQGEPVDNLNELEWIKGDILANVFPSDEVVRIDPQTGRVIERYDLSALKDAEEEQGDPDATNGIAFLSSEDRLFVTGKRWRHVYEIEVGDP